MATQPNKCKKEGRNRNKPAAKRRLIARPDLFRKAYNIARHNGDLQAWAGFRTDVKHDGFFTVRNACTLARKRTQRTREENHD